MQIGVLFRCAVLAVLFATAIAARPNAAGAHVLAEPKAAAVMVSISPSKTTMFAGETQRFMAIVIGNGETTVSWSVAEEDGGTVNSQGLYVAPKVQGVYHVIAASSRDPTKRAIAIITVLTYCDPPAGFAR